jgi:L-aminopeptidase/D-esterase-like protein
VIVVPPGAPCACEVRGQAPGSRETALLQPSGRVEHADAILLTGGSAFGLAAATGVVAELERAGVGHLAAGHRVPIVSAAVIFDLVLGDPAARPDAAMGAEAYRAARDGAHGVGSVGAGTGAAVGKLDGFTGWTKGGLGAASRTMHDGVTVSALAVVNAVGDVIGEDGEVLAGLRRDGRFVRSTERLVREPLAIRPADATTLVCVATDARLDKLQTWLLARAAHAGIARAVDPAATSFDGDVAFAIASCQREAANVVALGPVAALVTAAAIRDAVRQATPAPGCPALRNL